MREREEVVSSEVRSLKKRQGRRWCHWRLRMEAEK
jgi:hypothetical protein